MLKRRSFRNASNQQQSFTFKSHAVASQCPWTLRQHHGVLKLDFAEVQLRILSSQPVKTLDNASQVLAENFESSLLYVDVACTS